MLLPSNISTGQVVGQFIVGTRDGMDDDHEPDGIPASGRVTFTPSIQLLVDLPANPNPVTILLDEVEGVLDSEGYLCTPVQNTLEPAYRGVKLISTDNVDVSGVGWTWTAAYNFTSPGGSPPSHTFAVPSGSTLDLATVVPIPSSTGIGTEQAEALAASAQAAAVAASQDAAAAAQAAAEAAGAAQVTDTGISTLMTTEGTATQEAVAELVDASNAAKLDVDDAVNTYQSQASLDAAAAAKVGSSGSALNGAVKTLATQAAADAASGKLDAAQLDAQSAATVADNGSATTAKLREKYQLREELTISAAGFPWYVKADCKPPYVRGTDNADALDAVFAYARSLPTSSAPVVDLPSGHIRIGRALASLYRANTALKPLVIRGQDQLSSVIVTDFYGAGLVALSSADPAGVVRSSQFTIEDVGFASYDRNGPVPVYLDICGWGESRGGGIRFGPSNNTHARFAGIQNVRAGDIMSSYGGHHFNYKATDGLTFATTTGGVLTSSAALFTQADVGKIFNIYPTNRADVKYTISQYNSPTEVLVTGSQLLATTGAKGGFNAAEGSIAAGQTQFVADAPCFTADDAGRVIYIIGARAATNGAGNLRATIKTYTSPTTVELDIAAGVTVTRTEFSTPAIEFYTMPNGNTNDATTNDFILNALHIENNYGVGLCTQPNIFVRVNDFKVHGEHDPVDARQSTAAMWLDDYSGHLKGVFDGVATGRGRIHLSSMNDSLILDGLGSRRARNEIIFRLGVMPDPKAIVSVQGFTCYQTTLSGSPYDMVEDPNTSPKLNFFGLVDLLGDGSLPRFYVGKDRYYLPNGQFVAGPSVSASSGIDQILSGQTGFRTMYEDYATKKFSIGNVAGGGTAFTITDETTGQVRMLINNTGSIVPGADSTQPLGSSTSRWSDVATKRLTIGANIIHDSGTGSPEGVVTAGITSTWARTDGAPGTYKYEKRSGTGNTGWQAIW